MNRIERKMDKESRYTKGREHKYCGKISETRIDDRHHQHSSKHSSRRPRSSSSLSLVKKHKRKTRVDEIKGILNNIKPPTFDDEKKKG